MYARQETWSKGESKRLVDLAGKRCNFWLKGNDGTSDIGLIAKD